MVIDPEHGTIDSPLHPDQVQVDPSIPQAVKRLNEMGFGLVIISNQPASAKGKTSRQNLAGVHARVLDKVQSQGGRILGSYICYHQNSDHCQCRKPKTGLLEQAFKDHPEFNPQVCWMVGDGLTDMEAGQKFGLKTAFIADFKLETERLLDERKVKPTIWVKDLSEFADAILKNHR
jgi:D-glycero-D-manno-heptose 1,7-bisphosphate phosphatase